MDAVDRFLALVQRELATEDVRIEYGAPVSITPRVLSASLDDGWRVVATYAIPPNDRAARQHQLEAIATGFAAVLRDAAPPLPEVGRSAASPSARAELDRLLDVLVERSGAHSAAVVDVDSPILWGTSARVRPLQEIDQLTARAEVDAGVRALARALGALDDDAGLEDGRAWLTRSIAGTYRVIVAFDGPAPGLSAEARLARALPVLERVVLALPPRDPRPESARVLRMWPR